MNLQIAGIFLTLLLATSAGCAGIQQSNQQSSDFTISGFTVKNDDDISHEIDIVVQKETTPAYWTEIRLNGTNTTDGRTVVDSEDITPEPLKGDEKFKLYVHIDDRQTPLVFDPYSSENSAQFSNCANGGEPFVLVEVDESGSVSFGVSCHS